MNIKVLALITAFSVIIVGFGVFAFQFRNEAIVSNSKKVQETLSPSVSPTTLPTASPSATPAGINKEKLKIEVLNGSEVSGQAAKLKTMLTDAGFKEVEAGNSEATSSSSIRFGKQITQMQKDNLLKEFQQIIKLGISPENSTDFDISIVIGKNFLNP